MIVCLVWLVSCLPNSWLWPVPSVSFRFTTVKPTLTTLTNLTTSTRQADNQIHIYTRQRSLKRRTLKHIVWRSPRNRFSFIPLSFIPSDRYSEPLNRHEVSEDQLEFSRSNGIDRKRFNHINEYTQRRWTFLPFTYPGHSFPSALQLLAQWYEWFEYSCNWKAYDLTVSTRSYSTC